MLVLKGYIRRHTGKVSIAQDKETFRAWNCYNCLTHQVHRISYDIFTMVLHAKLSLILPIPQCIYSYD